LIGALSVFVIVFITIKHLQFSLWLLLPTLIVSGLFYCLNMRRYLLRRRWVKAPFPEKQRAILLKFVPFYRNLAEKERTRFENSVTIFLRENKITGIGTALDEETRVLVAASAVMLIFGRPEWEYPRLPEILIYPRSFDEEYEFSPERGDRVLAGMVVPQNGIVISRQDLLSAFRSSGEAYHVGLHEFAHALDLTDGVAEGIPAYVRAPKVKEWYELIRQELQNVREGRSVLNRYAGKNQAELFAVAVEHFFQRPDELKQYHPRLYDALASFLNQYPTGYVS
jgi:Mlc titration factor MtfA (ptsG expression regulator)